MDFPRVIKFSDFSRPVRNMFKQSKEQVQIFVKNVEVFPTLIIQSKSSAGPHERGNEY